MHLSLLTILVRDYDEAIAFYTAKLGFELIEDADLGGGKRWVCVAPPARGLGFQPRSANPDPTTPNHPTSLLLARATTPAQVAAVGHQTGGRVMGFFHTDDFDRDFTAMQTRGVRFVRPVRDEPYGTVAVFEDLYGNLFDLIGPRLSTP